MPHHLGHSLNDQVFPVQGDTTITTTHHLDAALVTEDSGLSLLRTYWYDGSRDGRLTDEQEAARDSPFVKVRLGLMNSAGQQKGVDGLLFKDLTLLAQQHAMCIAYLVAGDGDMVEAVRMAEDLGVQVVLVSVTAAGDSAVSDDLIAEVDKDIELDQDFLKPYVNRRGCTPGR